MKYTLILLTFLFFNCSSNKTNFEKYDKFVWKGMLDFKDKNYVESLSNFEEAFKIIPDENVSDYFYAAASALNLGKTKKAKELIKQAIIKTNASESYFQNFTEFNEFRNDKIFAKIQNNYAQLTAEFFENLENPKIYREIENLLEKDQNVRNNDVTMEVEMKTDSLNISRLIEITKEYGWQEKGWLILWHQRRNFEKNDFVWSYFRPFINEQIENGKIRKDFWTMFEEEKSIINNKRQIYGLYTNQFEQFPITDIENVDKRREEMGQPPLWYLHKVYGIELPNEYKKTTHNN